MLAIWRAHGLDVVLRDAWEAGVVMAGGSAGANCWFEASTTDSYLMGNADPLPDGLGLVAGELLPALRQRAVAPAEPTARWSPTAPFRRASRATTSRPPISWARDLAEIVVSADGSGASASSPTIDGGASETVLPVRLLEGA